MKKIVLTKGAYATVDDEDFEWLNKWKWSLSSVGYAVRVVGGRKHQRMLLMHRVIMKTSSGMFTDHINRNRLDNRRRNLRNVSPSQSLYNTKLRKDNTSGAKGVYQDKRDGAWVMSLWFDRKHITKRFWSFADAVRARKTAETIYHHV